MGRLSYENLIDHIKICAAFENYNKAVLLARGYVVHAINQKKNPALAKLQEKEPVLISDFRKSNDFVRDEQSGELYLEGFRDFMTISFSKTLSPEYQKVICLDGQFLDYLRRINEGRNRLHFYKNYAGAFGLETYLKTLAYAKTYGIKRLKDEIDRIVEMQKKF